MIWQKLRKTRKKNQYFLKAIIRKAAVEDERKAFCLWQNKSV